MEEDVKAFIVGLLLGAIFALVTAVFPLAEATDSRDALCRRAFEHATASDSLDLARPPYRCDISRTQGRP